MRATASTASRSSSTSASAAAGPSSGAAAARAAPSGRRGRRRRAVALLTALVASVLAGCGGGGGASPPPAAATRLVPANALVYVHLSLGAGRTGAARTLLARFPSWPRLRRAVVTRLSAPGCPLGDIGDEAALALLPGPGGTAGSLVLVRSDAKIRPRQCGELTEERIGDFLAVGQAATIQAAKDLAQGHGRSLADVGLYRKATGGLPDARVADAWATAAGVRRLLAPQSGLLGIAGTLLDEPGLRAAAVGVTAEKGRARITVRRELTRAAGPDFRPSLTSAIPASAFAFLDVKGLGGQLARLLDVGGPLLGRARQALDRAAGGTLDRNVLSLFRGEVGLALTPALPAPVLTLVAPAADPAATGRTLARLAPALRGLLKGIDLRYAVVGNRLVVATRPSGLDAVRRPGPRLQDSDAWKAVLPEATAHPASSLIFLDFSQLLRLGERTGLTDSRAYRAVRDDLRQVRAIGARTASDGSQSTAEILLSLP